MKKALIVAIFAAGTLFAVPVSAAALYPTGTLIKAPERAEVFYLASDGRRYQFPNMETLRTWYPEKPTILTTKNTSELSRIRDSRVSVTVRPGRTLVKFPDSPKVYAVENGAILRWLKTENDAIRTYGLNWQERIVVLPTADRLSYAIGADSDAHTPFQRLAVIQKATDIEQELKARRVLQEKKPASASTASAKNGGNTAALKNLRENLKANLSPRFSPTVRSYALTANYDEDTLLLTPTAFDPSAIIRIGDMTVASGKTIRIHLDKGNTIVHLFVTTVTNRHSDYTIVVRRVEPSTDTYLANIRENLRADFTETFDPMDLEYTLSAAYDEEYVRLIPEVNDKRSTIVVNDVPVKNRSSLTVPLDYGVNVILIIVRAENDAARTYTFTVHRSSFPRTEDRDLLSIRENLKANLSPAFDPNYTRYWIQADKDEQRATITVVPRVKTVRVSINGDPVTSKTILLHDEETEVVIRVNVTEDFWNEYTVIIKKPE